YWYSTRLTYQATPRNKFAAYVSEQPRHTDGKTVTGTRAFEAGRSHRWNHNQVVQATWKSPITSRLLLETNFTDAYMSGNQGAAFPDLADSDIVSVTDTGTGYTYRSAPEYNYPHYHTRVGKA